MFTVCPKCTLILGVTANDLRIGQGYVRCGRCLNVFNALLTLSEEPDAAVEGDSPHADRASQSQITAAMSAERTLHGEPASAATDTGSATRSGGAAPGSGAGPAPVPGVSPADGPPRDLPLEHSSDGGIESASSLADGTGTFETIVLEGDAITATEEFVPEESVDSEMASLARRLGIAANEPIATPMASAAQTAARARASSPVDTAAEAPEVDTPAAEAPASDALPASSAGIPARRWPWWTGSLLAALLLAGQLVDHRRDVLAASPTIGTPLRRLYGAIGIRLDPRWQLAAYEVRQEGAASDPVDPHVIRVRLSVANHALRAQPAPLLRLTLLDRFGRAVAARDLTPAQYWPRGAVPRTLLARDERIDSEVAVRDPADSVSFELDVCLADLQGAVRCAGDLPAAPAAAAAAANHTAP